MKSVSKKAGLTRFAKLSSLAVALHAGSVVAADQPQWLLSQPVNQQTQSAQFDITDIQLKTAIADNALTLPMLSGNAIDVKVKANNVFAPDLAARFPDIKSYDLHNSNGEWVGSLNVSKQGVRAKYFADGHIWLLKPGEQGYQLQSRQAQHAHDFIESEPRLVPEQLIANLPAAKVVPGNNDIRTYRIAIATTAEYTQRVSSALDKEAVLAELAVVLNRLNPVFEREMGANFQLFANNDRIIFTDPDTDPFANVVDEDIDIVDEAIASTGVNLNEYDIGHLFGSFSSGGSGLAYVGTLCSDNFKALGVSFSSNPVSDYFYMDLVAHEIGHQFGASHTFNGRNGSCEGNKTVASAFEPGSGSTIMSYAGACSGENLQSRVDDYFHVRSIDQYYNRLSAGLAAQCGTVANNGNSEPVAASNTNVTIPANSPFVLEGSATDADGDTLTYQWEQFDLEEAGLERPDINTDSGSGPLFRSYEPSTSPVRYLPRLQDVIDGSTALGETIPTTERDINFRFVVRDGQGAIDYSTMRISTTLSADPIEVTAPADGDVWSASGEQMIRWNTGGTELPPVSCATVDIMLSKDGGVTFDTQVAQGVANSGEYMSNYVSAADATDARIMVKCATSVFYNLSASFSMEKGEVSISQQVSTFSVEEDGSFSVSLGDFVIANPANIDISDLNIAVASGQNYTASGTQITPAQDFNGTLTFNVVLVDSAGNTVSEEYQGEATVTPVNDAPLANADSYTFTRNSSAQTLNVLSNDSDPDGDALTIVSNDYAGSGTLTLSDNRFSYTPANGFTGTETFNYVIEDASGESATALVTIRVNAPVTTPPANNDSGGGGSTGPVMWLLGVIALMARRLRGVSPMAVVASAIALSGCQSTEARNTAQVKKNTEIEVNHYDVLWQNPDAAAQLALSRGDTAMWIASRKGGHVYEAQDWPTEKVKRACGIRYLPHSGDAIQPDEKNQRMAMRDYAKRYNAIVKPHCAEKLQ